MPGELDSAIRERLDAMQIKGPPDRTVNALYAVLDLHQSRPVETHVLCVQCSTEDYVFIRYPCPTVQAIARAFGVTEETDNG